MPCAFDIISIHALLAESDHFSFNPQQWHLTFLSTLSLRRATVNGGALLSCLGNFYPRSPCGERRVVSSAGTTGKSFLSTLSLRRATQPTSKNRQNWRISIHALLAESDAPNPRPCLRSKNFYPRSPCGERPVTPMVAPPYNYFYPRSPCGERPPGRAPLSRVIGISIHALLAESDPYSHF